MSETETAIQQSVEAMRAILPHVENESLVRELAQIIRDSRKRSGGGGDKSRAILSAILKFCPPNAGDALAAVVERADAIYEDAHKIRQEAYAARQAVHAEAGSILHEAQRKAAVAADLKLTEEKARLARIEAKLEAERKEVAQQLEALRRPHADIRQLFTDLIRAAGYGEQVDWMGNRTTPTPVPSVALCGAFAALGSLMGSNPVSINVSTSGPQNEPRR